VVSIKIQTFVRRSVGESLKFLINLDPPKSPESKGDFEKALVPPFLRGARGDLDYAKSEIYQGF